MLATEIQSYEIEVLDRHTHPNGPTDTDVEELIHKLLEQNQGDEVASDHLLVIGHDDILPEILELYKAQLPKPWKISGHYVIWLSESDKEARDLSADINETIHGDWWVIRFI